MVCFRRWRLEVQSQICPRGTSQNVLGASTPRTVVRSRWRFSWPSTYAASDFAFARNERQRERKTSSGRSGTTFDNACWPRESTFVWIPKGPQSVHLTNPVSAYNILAAIPLYESLNEWFPHFEQYLQRHREVIKPSDPLCCVFSRDAIKAWADKRSDSTYVSAQVVTRYLEFLKAHPPTNHSVWLAEPCFLKPTGGFLGGIKDKLLTYIQTEKVGSSSVRCYWYYHRTKRARSGHHLTRSYFRWKSRNSGFPTGGSLFSSTILRLVLFRVEYSVRANSTCSKVTLVIDAYLEKQSDKRVAETLGAWLKTCFQFEKDTEFVLLPINAIDSGFCLLVAIRMIWSQPNLRAHEIKGVDDSVKTPHTFWKGWQRVSGADSKLHLVPSPHAVLGISVEPSLDVHTDTNSQLRSISSRFVLILRHQSSHVMFIDIFLRHSLHFIPPNELYSLNLSWTWKKPSEQTTTRLNPCWPRALADCYILPPDNTCTILKSLWKSLHLDPLAWRSWGHRLRRALDGSRATFLFDWATDICKAGLLTNFCASFQEFCPGAAF